MTRRTVILANGDFPKAGGKAWKLLAGARRVVACDGAADVYQRNFGRWPDVTIGDMDSKKTKGGSEGKMVVVSEQETNDLEKAIIFCRRRKWHEPVIVGATGKREDHMMGNISRAYENGLEIVTDFGRFVPIKGKEVFRVVKGTAISVFAFRTGTRMKSKGLEWALDGVRFGNLHCATLNRASAPRVELMSNKLVYVYIAEREGK